MSIIHPFHYSKNYPIYFKYFHYLSHIFPVFKTMIPRKLSLPAPPCRHPPAADHRSPCRGQDSDRFQPGRGMTTRTAMLGPALSIPDMTYIYITHRYIEIYTHTNWYTYTYIGIWIYIYISIDISNLPIYLSIYVSVCLSVWSSLVWSSLVSSHLHSPCTVYIWCVMYRSQ